MNNIDTQYLDELDWRKREAEKSIAEKLLVLLEQQQRILEKMLEICKQGEKL